MEEPGVSLQGPLWEAALRGEDLEAGQEVWLVRLEQAAELLGGCLG